MDTFEFCKPDDLYSFWESLKCSNCNKYLSVGPIYYSESCGNVCGRCVKDVKVLISTGVLQRAATFELLAKHFKFPCSNTSLCKASLKWSEVLVHEDGYNHQITCPVCNASCCTITELHKHIYSSYKKCMFRNNTTLKAVAVSGTFFIDEFDQKFFVRFKVSANNVQFNVKYLPSTSAFNYTLYEYQIQAYPTASGIDHSKTVKGDIEISNNCAGQILLNLPNDGNITFIVNIFKKLKMEVHTTHYDRSLKKQAITNAIQNYHNINLQQPTSTVAQLHDKNDDYLQHLEMKIFEELECPICMNYMKPPIYSCNLGHSICNHCKNSMNNCPTCKSQLKGGQNFALQRLSEVPKYPCNFAQLGCQEKYRWKCMDIHVAQCVYRTLKCPTGICAETICVLQARDHFEEKHPTLLFKEDHLLEKPIGTQHMSCNYTIFDDRLFILKFECEDESLPIK